METDANVVERVLDEDVKAFEVLVRRYERAVRAKVWMVLQDPHLVDEAAQQAFVTAFERLASLLEGALRGDGAMLQVNVKPIEMGKETGPNGEDMTSWITSQWPTDVTEEDYIAETHLRVGELGGRLGAVR